MNLANTLAVSSLSTAALVVVVFGGANFAVAADAESKESFCQNLAGLESHIVAGSLALNATNQYVLTRSTSACACGLADDDDEGKNAFAVDCSLDETYNVGSVTKYFERMVFRLDETSEYYSLAETSWGKDYVSSLEEGRSVTVTREEYYFEDDDGSTLVGCKVNACKSCSVCEDKRTVEYDCRVEVDYQKGGDFKDCVEGYTGGFVNTFDFGPIVVAGNEEQAAVAAEENRSPESNNSRDSFCESLADLESHMDESFDAWKGQTFLSTHECACSGSETDAGGGADESFLVDCTVEGADGHVTFERSERMTFELVDGGVGGSARYELRETSWDWKDSYALDDDEEETFFLENGVIVGCEARGCVSCSVCDDGRTIAVDCANRDVEFYSHECGDGYTGSFSHTFDFGVIEGGGVMQSDTGTVRVASEPNRALARRAMSWMVAVPPVFGFLVSIG